MVYRPQGERSFGDEAMIQHSLDTKLPNRSARIMRDAADELRLSWREVCSRARIDPDAADEPFGHMTGASELRLQHSYACATAGLSRSWIELGRNYRLLSYGPIGVAMMSARDVAEGVQQVLKHQELTFSLLRYIPVYDDGRLCAVEADEREIDPALRDFSVYRDMGAVQRMLSDMLQAPFPLESLEVTAPEPADLPPLLALYDCPIRFDAPRTVWRFKKGTETLSLPLQDRLLNESTLRECEHLSARRQVGSEVSGIVARMLENECGSFPSASEVATRLGFSSRTMNRRLAEEGTSLGILQSEARVRRAGDLLRYSDLSVEAISSYLGYSDAACFSRAFKRSTGRNPSAFRKESSSAVSRAYR